MILQYIQNVRRKYMIAFVKCLMLADSMSFGCLQNSLIMLGIITCHRVMNLMLLKKTNWDPKCPYTIMGSWLALPACGSFLYVPHKYVFLVKCGLMNRVHWHNCSGWSIFPWIWIVRLFWRSFALFSVLSSRYIRTVAKVLLRNDTSRRVNDFCTVFVALL